MHHLQSEKMIKKINTYSHPRIFALLFGIIIAVFAKSLLACSMPEELQIPYHVIGSAYDKNQNKLYTEELNFSPSPSGGILITRYSDSDTNTIAIKTVDFECHPTAPAFELEDMSNGDKEGVRRIIGENSIESFQSDSVKSLTPPTGVVIIDAGFDNTIKLNWEILVSGERLTVSYLFARENKFLKLRLEQAPTPPFLQAPPWSDSGSDIVFFKISANNFLFRLLSDPLYVGYSRENMSLKYYIGPSNLPMMRDQKSVVIRYQDFKST